MRSGGTWTNLTQVYVESLCVIAVHRAEAIKAKECNYSLKT